MGGDHRVVFLRGREETLAPRGSCLACAPEQRMKSEKANEMSR